MSDSEIAALVVAVLMLGISWRSSRASRAEERAEDARRQTQHGSA
jgi:hypothetical protein